MAVEKIEKETFLARWLERRSYGHELFADLDSLAKRKSELSVAVTAVLPAREVASTVGTIVDAIAALNERAPLVDQVLVVDAGSADGTAEVARRHGAEVYDEDELMPGFGPAIGKGDAVWRALSVARGELILYLDADTPDFTQQFVYGMLAPLLTVPRLRFVKGSYSRPLTNGRRLQLDEGSRVTELTAKPLLSLFYPELGGFAQPLAGEMAATRELLSSIPYLTGYAVETAMLIDVLAAVGIEAMAQVDLGTRTNRNQSLHELSKMSYAVLLAVASRLRRDGRLLESGDEQDSYVRAIRSVEGLSIDRVRVEVVERPPIAGVM
jgi:glucosyl-3-phosphoglycerate synthase